MFFFKHKNELQKSREWSSGLRAALTPELTCRLNSLPSLLRVIKLVLLLMVSDFSSCTLHLHHHLHLDWPLCLLLLTSTSTIHFSALEHLFPSPSNGVPFRSLILPLCSVSYHPSSELIVPSSLILLYSYRILSSLFCSCSPAGISILRRT